MIDGFKNWESFQSFEVQKTICVLQHIATCLNKPLHSIPLQSWFTSVGDSSRTEFVMGSSLSNFGSLKNEESLIDCSWLEEVPFGSFYQKMEAWKSSPWFVEHLESVTCGKRT